MTEDYRDTDVLFECGCNIKHRWSTGMDFYYCGKHNLSMKVKPLE